MARGHTERGASAVEYAILAAMIAGVVIATVFLLGEDVVSLFDIANDSRW